MQVAVAREDMLTRKGLGVASEMLAPDDGDEVEWAVRTLGEARRVVGVLCGSDGGLAAAERLQDALVPARVCARSARTQLGLRGLD